MRATQLTSLLFGAALALSAQAEPPKLMPVPELPPPPGLPAGAEEPQITITQKGEDKIEEYRIRGQLYMIKVTPPHGRPYYLVDPRGNGQMVRYDDLSPNLLVPLWVLFRF